MGDTDGDTVISWNEYFMFSAMLAAKRSKDPCTRVGAVLVDMDKRIIGSGYNGMPTGINDTDVPWTKDSEEFHKNKYAYVVHAEANCIMNSTVYDLRGSTLYVTLYPCSSCTKMIIQKRINSVIFLEGPKGHGEYLASSQMLKLAGVSISKFSDLIRSDIKPTITL